MSDRLRVGVIGCGLVAQVMHLPFLTELNDRFEVTALCDLSKEVADACAARFGVGRTLTRWEDVVAERDLDAVLVLTSGSHAPIAVAAAAAGLHVFVEKPMCFSVDEGLQMIEAARRADVRLMVGYMKRYDPAYERLAAELKTDDLRLVRVTTLESPIEPYLAHTPLVPPPELDAIVRADLRADDDARVRSAVGDATSAESHLYRAMLLDSAVHEFNALRGLLGEPDLLEHVSASKHGFSLVLGFGATRCVHSWVDLPGIARYEQEFAFFAPDRRAILTFPSPFLRNDATALVLEGGDLGSSRSWRTVETISYEEGFRRELVEFHAAIIGDREPRTSGEDGVRDIALCQAILRSLREGCQVERPSELSTIAAGDVR